MNNKIVNALAVSGGNVLAGTTGSGVYISTNNGVSWTQTSFNYKTVYSILASGNNIYAGTTRSGVYISTDNGANWTQTSLNNKSILSLSISGNSLYAGANLGVYLSTNNGNSWTNIGLNSLINRSLLNVGSYLYSATVHSGVYYTTNNGNSWIQTSLNNQSSYSLLSVGNSIYAGTNKGLFQSTNSGTSWNLTLNNSSIRSLTNNGNNIFAGAERQGIYFSTNSGTTWSQIGLNNLIVNCLALKGNNLFSGTLYHGVYVSTNNGIKWTQTSLNNKHIRGLTSFGNNIITGTNHEVYVSSNDGVDWIQTNNLGGYLCSNNTNTFLGTNSTGIYKSTNGGINWTLCTSSIHPYIIVALGNNIYASDVSGSYYSTDNGNNWSSLGLENKDVTSFANIGNYIFAGTWGDGVLFSTNNGVNWTQTALNKTVRSLFSSGNILFAGSQSNGIYISTNNGASWIQKNEGFGLIIPTSNALIISNNYIFAGTFHYSVWRRHLSEIISGNHDFSAGPFIDFPEVFIKDSSYHIKARITNEGREPETNVPIRFLINGTQVGYYLRTLPAGGIDTVDFTWTPHTAGDFNVAIASALPTDINRSNDTVKTDVRVYSSPALPIFCDDFSGGTANWTITNDGGTCVWQTYSPPYPNVYSLPATSSGAVLSADADDCGSGTTLLSTATIIENVDCSLFENIYLEFDNDWNAIDEQDSAIVEVSYDGGTSWSSVVAWGGTDIRNTQESYTLPGADANPSVRIRFRSIQPGWDWWWTIDNVCLKGFPVTGLTQNSKIPTKYALMQNYPNPFNPTTKIRFDLPKSTQAKLIIYDILGREVTTLVNEKLNAGSYEVEWNGSSYPSGVYFYRLITKDFSQTKKMLMIK
ncbi:MAG: T9SS type A sorting domain-containing protein [Ignavibacteria bacterium]|nr:T9SS type A sorting domain-containing protein [Ignavibacteria bacterium]